MSTPDDVPPSPLPQPDLAFTPRRILGGFVLLAALIALLLRRRRPKRSSDD
jgi:hypothetical protein